MPQPLSLSQSEYEGRAAGKFVYLLNQLPRSRRRPQPIPDARLRYLAGRVHDLGPNRACPWLASALVSRQLVAAAGTFTAV
jgi:hypothetical protein